MIRVIRGKIVGQHLSIEAIERMDVGRTFVRRQRARFAQDTVIINEDGTITLPEAQRFVADGIESKTRRRRGRWFLFGILRGERLDWRDIERSMKQQRAERQEDRSASFVHR